MSAPRAKRAIKYVAASIIGGVASHFLPEGAQPFLAAAMSVVPPILAFLYVHVLLKLLGWH